ncbi:TetR/AcrR family transcriptional regulator [Parvibaculum sp.]|jgi:AcrR family transcriptional regulator|uniref:TetR/AcrR family transcriptional regulator n=1 Tax=Parvibaculum sp. TaxID=2024848 RepID=UPI002FD994A7
MPRGPNTKTEIERAALELFVSQGIMETRTKQIAEAVKISEGTIYRHFESKDALARELFMRQHASLAEAIKTAAAKYDHIDEQARAIVEVYCNMADGDWLLFRYHQVNQYTLLRYLDPKLPNPVSVVVEVIEAAMKRREIPKDDANVRAAMALGIVLQAVTFKAFGRLKGPLIKHRDLFSKSVIDILHLEPAGK